MSRAGFEPGIFDSLLLEFAVAHKPTQPPRPNENDSFYLYHFNVEDLMGIMNLAHVALPHISRRFHHALHLLVLSGKATLSFFKYRT